MKHVDELGLVGERLSGIVQSCIGWQRPCVWIWAGRGAAGVRLVQVGGMHNAQVRQVKPGGGQLLG